MADSIQQHRTQVCVLGSGPGGYSAAFRAADLGLSVTLVERYDTLGGVCLNVGCIPSKTYLHMAEILNEVPHMAEHGIDFGAPTIDAKAIRAWKQNVVGKLTQGLAGMAKKRKVTNVVGEGRFKDAHTLTVTGQDGSVTEVVFEHLIVAAGSEPVNLPFVPEDPRIFDSTGALELERIDGSLLVLGGGIIGCEMATVYQALGAQVTVVEMMPQIMAGADPDIVKPCQQVMASRGVTFQLNTKVTAVEATSDGIQVTFEGADAPKEPVVFDQMLVAVGRTPNGGRLDAEKAGVHVDARGFMPSDATMRTNVPHIYAIGDLRGNPMLAHKAVPEGRLAAEVIAGKPVRFDARCIPSVAYTDPEVAWVGLTEQEAKDQEIAYETGVFPWAASGRALSQGRSEGLTKLIVDADTHQILGAGIVGRCAGELIGEMALAIEMGCDVQDVALTIHPHPTLAESMALASEVVEGTITDLYLPRKKRRSS